MSSIRHLLTAIFIFSLRFILTACGKGIEGSWKLTGGNAVSAIYSIDSLENSGSDVVFNFNGDGSLSIDMIRGSESSTASGTWEENGDSLTIIMNGSAIRCSHSIKKDSLSIQFTLNGQNASFELIRK